MMIGLVNIRPKEQPAKPHVETQRTGPRRWSLLYEIIAPYNELKKAEPFPSVTLHLIRLFAQHELACQFFMITWKHLFIMTPHHQGYNSPNNSRCTIQVHTQEKTCLQLSQLIN
ncbi:hypothetical protein CEP54_005433 [Fusarium duplospermum]|uniref:Uncharacterized protein n=1 Tax=Fusarium duplospermum TaxID=1325734 RepID=A0A428QCW3_9HYPO|nr:hypothetical protein CEP54_005433 [Fusarium duplospermum]